MKRTVRRIPARIGFAESAGRWEAWGWLEELTASAARLSAQAELRRDETLSLTFELPGEPFAGLAARVAWSQRDADGYWEAELRFTSELDRRRLAAALLDLLSRAF